jgi:hypothetical protein
MGILTWLQTQCSGNLHTQILGIPRADCKAREEGGGGPREEACFVPRAVDDQ